MNPARDAVPSPVIRGVVHQLSISPGGVPKTAVPRTAIGPLGLEGDAHHDPRHGGPDRAVCLFSLDVIERLRAEGHPISPGSIGENVTVRGVDWASVAPGGRFVFDGGVELEVTQYTTPCSTIRGSFAGAEFRRVKQDVHPGESRVYARVTRGGAVSQGDAVTYVAGSGAGEGSP